MSDAAGRAAERGFRFNPADYRRPTDPNRLAAHRLAEVRVAVFPCAPDKRPLVRWRQESTDDFDQIEDWWARWPHALVGIDLAKCGLVVVDADRHGGPDGVAALAAIVGDNLLSFGCPIIETPGNGLHLVFSQPPGAPLGNSPGALPAGIDVRGSGGFVIGVGSILADGRSWRAGPQAPDLVAAFAADEIPPLPDALLGLIRAATADPQPERTASPPKAAMNFFGGRDPDAGRSPRPKPEPKGDGFFRAVNNKALQNIGSWVTGLFSSAKFQPGTGAYRVSSRSLGRALQEDLSIAPDGIVDFGVADMGDAQLGKRTAIDLVMEHGGAPDVMAAAMWLCDQLGVHPEALGWRERKDAPAWGEAEASASTNAGDATGQDEHPASGADPLAGFTFDGDVSSEPPRMLVKKLLPFTGIAFIGGQSGAGKTFIAVDLAVSLAAGEPFFGRKVTERVGVVILAAEGAGTLASRIEVAKEHKAEPGEFLPVAWLDAVPDIAQPREARALIARLKEVGARFQADHGVRLGCVVVDTVAAALNIEDENSNAEAAKAIRIMNEISRETGALVVPVSHFGKTAENGLRGASAWRAGADVVLAVTATRDELSGDCTNRRIALTKSRTGEEGWACPFDLRFVPLGEDEDGDTYGACYVEPGRPEDETVFVQKGKSVPRTAKAYLAALLNALAEKGETVRPFGAEGGEVRAVDREVVRHEFYPAWPAGGEDGGKKDAARRKAFRRGEEMLLQASHIATHEIGGRQMVWTLREAGQ